MEIIPEVVTCRICDKLARGEVKVQQLGAVATQVQGCSVRDLAAVGEDKFVNEMTVLGEGPVNKNITVGIPRTHLSNLTLRTPVPLFSL